MKSHLILPSEIQIQMNLWFHIPYFLFIVTAVEWYNGSYLMLFNQSNAKDE